jgi:hypothetical protein
MLCHWPNKIYYFIKKSVGIIGNICFVASRSIFSVSKKQYYEPKPLWRATKTKHWLML